MEKLIMEECSRTSGRWSNKELRMLSKQRERIREVEEQSLRRGILQRDTNCLNFYDITPKEELPKFLQKMRFQTLHLKESNSTSTQKTSPTASKSSARKTAGRKSWPSAKNSGRKDTSCSSPKCTPTHTQIPAPQRNRRTKKNHHSSSQT